MARNGAGHAIEPGRDAGWGQLAAARRVAGPGTRKALVTAGLVGGLFYGLACGLAGCSPGAAVAGDTCGTVPTGANVPVVIKVAKGPVDCSVALRVERAYATMIRYGDIRGNGGGAPVKVAGWTCQGYPTPQVLRTGNASECHTASAEVLAVLAVPSTGS